MPTPFDGLAAAAFLVVSNAMGRPATWAPSAGGGPYSAAVLFNAPTNEESRRVVPSFEYQPADFPGLFEALRNGSDEQVTVDGTTYAVEYVEAIHDGRTYRATLGPA